MFPKKSNDPYIKNNGQRSTLGDVVGSGGSSYELPTASANEKGGVKIGSGLTMTGEVLSADSQLPSHSTSDEGKVLAVNSSGALEWATLVSNPITFVRSPQSIDPNQNPTVTVQEVV